MADRACHYCGLPIPENEKPVQAVTGNAWAHFECWYDGEPFPRDPDTGRQLLPPWAGTITARG